MSLSAGLSDQALAGVLSELPIRSLMNPASDIVESARAHRLVLLKSLIATVDPAACPDTLELTGDGTLRRGLTCSVFASDWERIASRSLASTMEEALVQENIEVLEVLIQHDAVLRTLIMRTPKILSTLPETSALRHFIKNGLEYAPTRDRQMLARVMSFRGRVQRTPMSETGIRSALNSEARLLARTLPYTPSTSIQMKAKRHLTRTMLEMGLEVDLQTCPLVLANGSIQTFNSLVDQTGITEARYPRQLPEMQQLALTLANQCVRRFHGFELSMETEAQLLRTLAHTDKLLIPIQSPDEVGGWLTLQIGEHEWRYLNTKQLVDVIAGRLLHTANLQAQAFGQTLLSQAEVLAVPAATTSVGDDTGEKIPTLTLDQAV